MAAKVFGVDLETLVKQQQAEVPKLVTHVLEFLKAKKGMSVSIYLNILYGCG